MEAEETNPPAPEPAREAAHTEESEPTWATNLSQTIADLPARIAAALMPPSSEIEPTSEPAAPDVTPEPDPSETPPDPVLEITEPAPAPTRQQMRRRQLW